MRSRGEGLERGGLGLCGQGRLVVRVGDPFGETDPTPTIPYQTTVEKGGWQVAGSRIRQHCQSAATALAIEGQIEGEIGF